jgi:hypothetical protein
MKKVYRGPAIDASYQVSVKVLYKDCLFSTDPLTNMATTDNLVSDWLISKKSSPLKPLG